jgi:predicted nucleic acid-binding protein
MPSKKYADSDFFLALLKDSDWLKERAKKIYEENKDEIWVSPFTIVELMIVCVREDIPLKETLLQISRIAGTTYIKWDFYFRAADYVEQGATIFDALMMSFAKQSEIDFSDNSEIISSDKVYEKFGFKIINLKK